MREGDRWHASECCRRAASASSGQLKNAHAKIESGDRGATRLSLNKPESMGVADVEWWETNRRRQALARTGEAKLSFTSGRQPDQAKLSSAPRPSPFAIYADAHHPSQASFESGSLSQTDHDGCWLVRGGLLCLRAGPGRARGDCQLKCARPVHGQSATSSLESTTMQADK